MPLRIELRQYKEDYDGLQATAEQAASNILQQCDMETDQDRAEQKKAATNSWLQGELKSLKKRLEHLEWMAERRMVMAGKKVYALFIYAQSRKFLSSEFMIRFETWQQLDAVDIRVREVATPQHGAGVVTATLSDSPNPSPAATNTTVNSGSEPAGPDMFAARSKSCRHSNEDSY